MGRNSTGLFAYRYVSAFATSNTPPIIGSRARPFSHLERTRARALKHARAPQALANVLWFKGHPIMIPLCAIYAGKFVNLALLVWGFKSKMGGSLLVQPPPSPSAAAAAASLQPPAAGCDAAGSARGATAKGVAGAVARTPAAQSQSAADGGGGGEGAEPWQPQPSPSRSELGREGLGVTLGPGALIAFAWPLVLTQSMQVGGSRWEVGGGKWEVGSGRWGGGSRNTLVRSRVHACAYYIGLDRFVRMCCCAS